jgi:hypothetical protein
MKNDIHAKFGMCWNEVDFSSFSNKFLKDCTYDSFDYFYKLKGRQRLTEYFTNQANQNAAKPDDEIIDIYKGYCQKTTSVLKTIKECCIMVRRSDLKTIRILMLNTRFGKVTSVQGLNPEKIKSIRNTKI